MGKEKLIEYLRENGKTHSWVELANMFNIKPNGDNKKKSDAVRQIWNHYKKSEAIEVVEEAAKITKVKKWQLPNGEWRTSVQYSNDSENTTSIVESIEQHFKSYKAPKAFSYEKKDVKENAAVINLFDAHIDKLCLVPGKDNNITIEDNVAKFENAFDELLAQCLIYKPEIIYLPIGSDFFNANNLDNNAFTKKGTPQGIIGGQEDSFNIGISTYRKCIDKAAQYCNVICPVIKGNHDEDKIFYLGVVLKIAYESNPNVFIDNTTTQRKYYQYGDNLFGFAHGDKEKSKINQLPLIMAEEVKQMWANTTYREWYLGDIHHKQEFQFMRGKDFIGCTVRFLRCIGTSDNWHLDSGYIGIPKTAEAFIWKKEGGLLANFQNHIK